MNVSQFSTPEKWGVQEVNNREIFFKSHQWVLFRDACLRQAGLHRTEKPQPIHTT